MTLTVPNNADMDVSIAFKHKDGGGAYSLVGVSSILMHVRAKADDVAAVLHFSSADGSLVIDGAPVNGKIKAKKAWSQISHLAGSFEFDVVAQFPDTRRAIYRDTLVFVQGVTR